jgi:hypothetical protein
MPLDVKVVVNTREQVGDFKISERGIVIERNDSMALMFKRRLNL